jgi:hypothetical protein
MIIVSDKQDLKTTKHAVDLVKWGSLVFVFVTFQKFSLVMLPSTPQLLNSSTI